MEAALETMDFSDVLKLQEEFNGCMRHVNAGTTGQVGSSMHWQLIMGVLELVGKHLVSVMEPLIFKLLDCSL